MEVEGIIFCWDEFSWVGQLTLPSWCGYQCRQGPYCSMNSIESSDGAVQVYAEPENGEEKGHLGVIKEMAVSWLKENESAVQKAILDEIVRKYPDWQEQYGYSQSEADEIMPNVSNPEEFHNLIGLSNVHLHDIENGSLPYIGFELGCTWDDEHGLGVLLHGTRIVESGGADTSMLSWIAERDAETNA